MLSVNFHYILLETVILYLLSQLISSVNESKKKAAAWKDLLESSALKPTILAVSLMVFQQLAAIDAVMFYTVDIFASSGADINENLSANIVGAIQVVRNEER